MIPYIDSFTAQFYYRLQLGAEIKSYDTAKHFNLLELW